MHTSLNNPHLQVYIIAIDCKYCNENILTDTKI